MHQATRAETHRTVRWSWFQTVRTSAAGLHRGWEKEVEALWQSGKVQGDGQHCTTGGGPLSVWKHGVTEKGVLGEREVERQLHVPCGEPRFEGPQVAK